MAKVFLPVKSSLMRGCLPAATALLLATVVVFTNGLFGSFVYDDTASIRENPYIRHLWPLTDAMSLPALRMGATVSGRPVLSLSLALNRALIGPEPWHYRIVNIAIHAAAGLLLFGIVRRTVVNLRLASGQHENEVEWPANFIAFGAALLWLVHPLQTASVTYIVQRAESLAGFFLLLTLYGAIRRLEGGRPAWAIVAGAACILGMGTKQSAFAAPALVLLYDYIFVSKRVGTALRAHPGLYVGLALGWVFLGVIVAVWQIGDPYPEIGARNPWPYALTQPGVILYYLRLSLWPSPILATYGWPYADTVWRILPPLIALMALAALTLWSILRRSWLGFVGAWFFLLLAPSSSLFPLEQVIQCQRMYLPLATLTVLVAVGVFATLTWIATRSGVGDRVVLISFLGLMGLLAAPLAYGTALRNRDYGDELVFWQDNVTKQPQSRAAQLAWATLLRRRNQTRAAEQQYRQAVAVNDSASPVEAHFNLGVIALGLGELDEAMSQFQKALTLRPFQAEIIEKIGATLAAQGRTAEAMQRFEQVFKLHCSPAVAAATQNDLGTLLSRQGKYEEAAAHYQAAIRFQSDYPEAYNNLGSALVRMGRYEEAVAPYESALRLSANNAEVHNNYGFALLKLGRIEESIRHLLEALRINPEHALARQNLAAAKAARGARLETQPEGRERGVGNNELFAP